MIPYRELLITLNVILCPFVYALLFVLAVDWVYRKIKKKDGKE